MKALMTFLLSLLLLAPAFGGTSSTSFLEAGKFIHLREVASDGSRKDSYIRATSIEEVEIDDYPSGEGDGKTVRLTITTQVVESIHIHDGTVLATNKDYMVDCADRADAEKIFAAIMAAISENKGSKAEAGAGKPANLPGTKTEGDNEPRPETEGSPR